MKRVWLRVISVLEIIGGIFGLAFMGWVVLTNPMNIFNIIIAIVAVGIYVLSFVAGVALWRGRAFGRIASIIVQAIQLPKIFSPAIIFIFSFGFDVWIHIYIRGFSNLGFELKLLASISCFQRAGRANGLWCKHYFLRFSFQCCSDISRKLMLKSFTASAATSD